ncbi:MAG: DUF4358 domain-containing protein [Oscillospiraceae bacterium]|nr:DUF4358 domain-containing protein [Oscillospiraceae bacterium]
MKTKKIMAFIAALSAAALMLAGCSSNEGTAEETTVETTTAAAEVETEASEAETEASESETEAESESETEAETEESVVEEGEAGGAVSVNPLQSLADAAMAVGEWPSLMEVTDEMILTDYYQFDLSKYESALVMQNPMSANMTEIIIFKSADVEAAKADLEARRENAINMHAFYPDDVERAEASIVGAEGEYAYFIMSDYAADAETALIEAIKAL